MSKIICEICGTTYPDSAEKCPICGWAQKSAAAGEEFDLDFLKEEVPASETVLETAEAADDLFADAPAAPERVRMPRRAEAAPSKGRKEKDIFDYDAVNTVKKPKMEEPEEDDEEEEEEESRPNTLLIVILVILIILLLATSGYIFWKYYLPGHQASEPETSVPATVMTEETEPTEESTVPTVPCTSLSLISGMKNLSYEGENWLLHIKASPDDTTDQILFVSEDESIVTVNEEGRVTAVAEGETRIIITCGDQRIECPVVVDYSSEETEETAAETESTEAETENTEEPKETEAAAETEAPTEAASETKPGIVLKLKKTDITFFVRGVYTTLQLDCDLNPEDVIWTVRDQSVATVKNGAVTAVGPGLTVVYAKYGDQTVECIVRCSF